MSIPGAVLTVWLSVWVKLPVHLGQVGGFVKRRRLDSLEAGVDGNAMRFQLLQLRGNPFGMAFVLSPVPFDLGLIFEPASVYGNCPSDTFSLALRRHW